jgi:hypothetical protein
VAIKAGQILHVANQFVVDRIQTGGPGNLNIPQEKVYELGNYQSVGIVRDVPDLTFSLDCLDVDTEVEALLTGSMNPYADAASTKYDLSKVKPIDIISPWKTGQTATAPFDAVRGVAVPALSLESASYRYGLRENAGEQFSLRGDSIYYIPGTPWQDVVLGSDLTAGVWTFANGPALLYMEGGDSLYALSVSVDGVRLTPGSDYTETATAVTFTPAPAAGAKVSIVYGSADTATYPQSGVVSPAWSLPGAGVGSNDNPDGLVHQGLAVKPAAIRGKDIDCYFSTAIPGVDLGAGVGVAVEVRWPDVQSVNIDWRVTIEDDYEFGNPRAVNRDFADVPAVTGSIELKPRSIQAMFTRLQQITGVPAAQIIGPQSSVAGALRVELRNPESGGSTAVAAGTVLKTHYVPDARFTIPGYEGRVQQKLSQTVNFESDGGILETYKGVRA